MADCAKISTNLFFVAVRFTQIVVKKMKKVCHESRHTFGMVTVLILYYLYMVKRYAHIVSRFTQCFYHANMG